MKLNKRGSRRQAEHRIKVRIEKRLTRQRWPHDQRVVGREASVHGVGCSCSMCCSPRYSVLFKGKERLTRQEIDALRDEREELEELE